MASLLVFSLILVVTLAVSGAAKIKDYSSTATAIFNLKIDKWLPIRVRTAARILPWAELALAVVLLAAPGVLQIVAAICALLLFAFYWLVIARAVMSGNTASCNCFGTASSAPISRWTLARNTALVAASVVVVAGAIAYGSSPVMLLLTLNLEQWFWLTGTALAAATLWFIYKSEMVPAIHAPAHRTAGTGLSAKTSDDASTPQAEGSEGSIYTKAQEAEEVIEEDYVRLPIPFGQLTEYQGQPQNLRQLAARQARVLLWVSPTCGSCLDVIAKIGEWQHKLNGAIGIHPVVINEDSARMLDVPDATTIFIDDNYSTQANFGGGTPMAVALGMDGLMAGGPVFGCGDVIDFMNDLLVEFDVA